MLKHILVASMVTIAVPALAQSQVTTAKPAASQPTSRTPGAAQSVMTQPTDANTAAMPATPATTATATPSTAAPATAQAMPAPGATTTTPMASTATAAIPQPVSGDQVAQVVATEFPGYDKDSNGTLSETEFAAWMVALKTASDPTTKADAPATKAWVGAAFAQADKDKSKTVSKEELTGFLGAGQKAS